MPRSGHAQLGSGSGDACAIFGVNAIVEIDVSVAGHSSTAFDLKRGNSWLSLTASAMLGWW
jgi:hypothetical protein